MQPSDSEKQCLIQPRMEPLDWTSCQEDKLSDSTSESSEEVSSVLDLWNPEPLCQETETMSKSDADLRRSARRKLYTACILTLVFMIGELIGGYAAHSLAIMTDAAHLLTDFGSILISIFSLWISSRPPTHTMTFGWHRAGDST
ncbi:zinc transporter 2-like [Cynoglossus semilaevis]|uniref:zinc transporter 2-like n=1 Tax=Cynoglossus semilaevis TaxID=244447 RepID=UPI0007DC8921|nr:zinc transporter 2-like [Cynoglossus semilaevis]